MKRMLRQSSRIITPSFSVSRMSSICSEPFGALGVHHDPYQMLAEARKHLTEFWPRGAKAPPGL